MTESRLRGKTLYTRRSINIEWKTRDKELQRQNKWWDDNNSIDHEVSRDESLYINPTDGEGEKGETDESLIYRNMYCDPTVLVCDQNQAFWEKESETESDQVQASVTEQQWSRQYSLYSLKKKKSNKKKKKNTACSGPFITQTFNMGLHGIQISTCERCLWKPLCHTNSDRSHPPALERTLTALSWNPDQSAERIPTIPKELLVPQIPQTILPNSQNSHCSQGTPKIIYDSYSLRKSFWPILLIPKRILTDPAHCSRNFVQISISIPPTTDRTIPNKSYFLEKWIPGT